MDKTIAWKLAGEGGTAWCVLGLLDNTEVEGGVGGGEKNEKMMMWYEEGEKRSRSEG